MPLASRRVTVLPVSVDAFIALPNVTVMFDETPTVCCPLYGETAATEAAFTPVPGNGAGTALPPKYLASLPALARLRLARHDVTRVFGGTWCTYDAPARFYSYRRDRVTGRMAALVWLEKGR